VRGFDDGGASRSGAGDVCRQKMDAVSVEVASGAVVVLGGSGVGVSGEDLGVAQGDAGVEHVGDRGVVVCSSPTRHLHQPEIAVVGASVDTPGHTVRTCRRDEMDRAVTEDQTGGLTRLVLAVAGSPAPPSSGRGPGRPSPNSPSPSGRALYADGSWNAAIAEVRDGWLHRPPPTSRSLRWRPPPGRWLDVRG